MKDMCGDMLLLRTIVSIVRRKLGDEADNPHLHLHRAPRRLPDADGRDAKTRRGRYRAESRGTGPPRRAAPYVPLPCHAPISGARASQPPSHISKTVLSIVTIGPPDTAFAVHLSPPNCTESRIVTTLRFVRDL